MRKSDGKTAYLGDFGKVVKASLFMNRMFIRDDKNNWLMDTNRCRAYEIKNLGEEYVYGYEKCRIPTDEEISNHYNFMRSGPVSDSQQAMHLQNLNLHLDENKNKIYQDIKIYKRRKELLEKFELIF